MGQRTAKLRWTTWALAVAVSSGCAANKRTTLVQDVREYNEGIRWNHTPQAASRLPAGDRDDFVASRAVFADELRVDDYEVIELKHEDDLKARARVRYTWHLDSRGVVHRTTTVQQWQRFGKRWMLVDERRVLGETMPGVEEPDSGTKSSSTPTPDARG